jgi:biotin carboxylase
VPTSLFVEMLPGQEETELQKLVQLVGWPLIIKPAVSYASISISDKSVVDNTEDALKEIRSMMNTNLGMPYINQDGVFVESFLAGREFTVLCTGGKDYGVTGMFD